MKEGISEEKEEEEMSVGPGRRDEELMKGKGIIRES